MRFLSICLISKNEARFLAEWLEYHLMLGVQHFYIYDNASDDDPNPVYAAYRDVITLHDWPLADHQQRLAYQHFIKNHAHETRWAAFIDADEFIVYTGEGEFPGYLAERQDENGIMMQWELFGTNGHVSRPTGLVLENYCRSYSRSPTPNIKTVCQPDKVLADGIVSPHRFPYADGRTALPELLAVLSVYHYILRSKQDLVEKLSRGDVWSAARAADNLGDLERAVQSRLDLYDKPDKFNPYMAVFVPELKRRLARRAATATDGGQYAGATDGQPDSRKR